MKPDNTRNDCKTQSKRTQRIPIPLSPDELERLTRYAEKDSRSNAAMAGIIYRLGEQAYTKLRNKHQR